MKVKASEILSEFSKSGLIQSMSGPDATAERIVAVEDAAPGTLVFVSGKEGLVPVKNGKPAIVVTTGALAKELNGTCALVTANVNLAQAHLRQRYADRNVRKTEWADVHPSAVVHESAKIGKGTMIAPNVVIGREAVIGEDCVIMAATVIEYGAKIGNHTVIHPGCVIGYDCEIGNNVIIRSGSIIGSEGFGFAQDEKRKHHRIPQTGKVKIGDRVVVGANNCFDRAAYKETIISSGCIFDNMVHVAHNVFMDEDCIIVAQSGIAGSSRLGKRVILSGQCGVIDHVNIVDDVVLVRRGAAFADVDKPGVYAWEPLMPLGDYMRGTVVLRKLGEMYKKVQSLEKRIAQLTEEKK